MARDSSNLPNQSEANNLTSSHAWPAVSNLALLSTNRPTWEEYFAQIAQVAATRSPCHRLHVGCVLVRDNRIVSQGYNGFLPGCEHESIVRDGHEQATVHAEQNAIADCAKRGVASAGCTAYITHYPCIICTRLLLAAGITEIRYIEEYRVDPLVALFCERLGVSITKVLGK